MRGGILLIDEVLGKVEIRPSAVKRSNYGKFHAGRAFYVSLTGWDFSIPGTDPAQAPNFRKTEQPPSYMLPRCGGEAPLVFALTSPSGRVFRYPQR